MTTTFRERLEGLWGTARETVEQLRQGYQAANEFARMRIWIVGALVADFAIVIAVLAVVGGSDTRVEVGLQTGFPGDMLILHNLDDDPLRDVRIVLDGRYEAELDQIEGDRTVGLELIREFRDPQGLYPPSSYQPIEARIDYEGGVEVHDVPRF